MGKRSSIYIPDYQLEWILMLREYHMYYDNRQLLEQVYPNVKGLLAYFEGFLSEERGLLGRVPGWVVLDHPDTFPQDVEGECTAMNCLYYGALNTAAWIARDIMQDDSQAAEWEEKAGALKRAILKHLWSEKDNAFKDGYESNRITQQTQVYALLYGLVPEAETDEVVSYVLSQGRSCEQSFSYWLLHALFRQGQGQFGLDYIRTYWGAQMQRADFNGAWHEMWDAGPGMTRSHAWCSGPTALLPEFVLGIEPLEPGWKHFKIQPRLHDLKWAEAIVPSVAGKIRAYVKKIDVPERGTGIQMDVEVPAHSTALIYVPVKSADDAVVSVNGQKIWASGKFIGNGKLMSYHSTTDEFLVFTCKSGHHSIRSETNRR